MSRFFLCHNPLANLPPDTAAYIYHYGKPRFFAHVLPIDAAATTFKHMDYAGYNKIFVYKTGDGGRQLFLLLVGQNIDRATAKLPPVLREAVEWYASVLNMEDAKTYGKNSQVSLLSDLNVLTPGLQILHLQKPDKFILSYPGGVKTFDDNASLDGFCRNTLGYEQVQLGGGYLNAI